MRCINRSVILTTQSGGIPQHLALSAPAADIEVVAHKPPHPEQTEATTFLPAAKYLMTIVTLSGVSEAFFLILPESLNPRRHFVPMTNVAAPCPLNSSCHVVPVSITHCFQRKQLNIRQF
jgi:hypothetical protein